MHPIVKPALRRGWRDLNTVQFGMAPAHAMVLGPMDTATGSFLELLDGTRGMPLLREQGREMGLPDGHVDGLVDRLARSGLLDDTTGGGPAATALREKKEVMDRLRSDLASLSLVAPGPGGAVERLAARRCLRVRVRGGRPGGGRPGRAARGQPAWARSRYVTSAASNRGTWRPADFPSSPSASAVRTPPAGPCAEPPRTVRPAPPPKGRREKGPTDCRW